MQVNIAIVAGVLLALGAGARAEAPDMPRRGHTFTTEDDVTRMDRHVTSDRTEVFILRGMEGKASNQQGPVTLPASPSDPPAAAAEPAPEPKKHKRGWNRN